MRVILNHFRSLTLKILIKYQLLAGFFFFFHFFGHAHELNSYDKPATFDFNAVQS